MLIACDFIVRREGIDLQLESLCVRTRSKNLARLTVFQPVGVAIACLPRWLREKHELVVISQLSAPLLCFEGRPIDEDDIGSHEFRKRASLSGTNPLPPA